MSGRKSQIGRVANSYAGASAPLPFRCRPCFDQAMGVQPIRLETLGDLVARGYGLNAMCGRCRHRRDLDMDALIARLGPSFRYVGKTVDRFLVCSACGGRQVETQIHVMDAGRRSRFAD
jgi:hypothetical protein